MQYSQYIARHNLEELCDVHTCEFIKFIKFYEVGVLGASTVTRASYYLPTASS